MDFHWNTVIAGLIIVQVYSLAEYGTLNGKDSYRNAYPWLANDRNNNELGREDARSIYRSSDEIDAEYPQSDDEVDTNDIPKSYTSRDELDAEFAQRTYKFADDLDIENAQKSYASSDELDRDDEQRTNKNTDDLDAEDAEREETINDSLDAENAQRRYTSIDELDGEDTQRVISKTITLPRLGAGRIYKSRFIHGPYIRPKFVRPHKGIRLPHPNRIIIPGSWKRPAHGIFALKGKKAIFCEHKGIKRISCSNDKVIKVRSALYGRTAGNVCGRSRVTNCRALNSFAIVQKKCNGHSSCDLNPSNSVFGDPCVGTVKYLNIKYFCVKRITPTTTPNGKTAIFCEHKGIKSISCSKDEEIKVKNALYGRTAGDVCGRSRVTNCRAPNSFAIVQKKCNGHNSCDLNPSNSVFGDPCVGTVKYLNIEYFCVKRTPPTINTPTLTPVTLVIPVQSSYQGDFGKSLTLKWNLGLTEKDRIIAVYLYDDIKPCKTKIIFSSTGFNTPMLQESYAQLIFGNRISATISKSSYQLTIKGLKASDARSFTLEMFVSGPGRSSCKPILSVIKISKINNINSDKVDGGYTGWSVYGPCSKACGGGVQERNRSCTNPAPANGGKACDGVPSETRACNTNQCPEASMSYASTKYPASNCIDGDINTRCHSKKGVNPWLKVDFHKKVLFKSVELIKYFKYVCCDAVIKISAIQSDGTKKLCATDDQAEKGVQDLEIELSDNCVGHSIELQLDTHGKKSALRLFEIKFNAE